MDSTELAQNALDFVLLNEVIRQNQHVVEMLAVFTSVSVITKRPLQTQTISGRKHFKHKAKQTRTKQKLQN